MGFDPRTEAMLGLQDRLYKLTQSSDYESKWPREQLEQLRHAEVYRWFAPISLNGVGWNDVDLIDGYRFISQSCLTTAFVLTQRTAAFSRIIASENEIAKKRWVPGLVDGSLFATVGISHLTTSRQHLSTPVLRAEAISEGQYRINGYSPWVTGASYADCLVVGATTENGNQLLAVVDRLRKGIESGPGQPLLGLTGSMTDQVVFKDVLVSPEDIIGGPQPNVLRAGKGSGAGGLQTSALALGLAQSAIHYLLEQSDNRRDLQAISAALQDEWIADWNDLRSLAKGTSNCSTEDLRQRANSLVLRATQSALTASKGAGYIASHPASRWCREALFFMVWSCPKVSPRQIFASLLEYSAIARGTSKHLVTLGSSDNPSANPLEKPLGKSMRGLERSTGVAIAAFGR